MQIIIRLFYSSVLTQFSGNPFTYTGREDDTTGLLYYRARYYDPELEAFISQDPLGDAQRYVDGNPVLLTDPLGMDSMLFNGKHLYYYDNNGAVDVLPENNTKGS